MMQGIVGQHVLPRVRGTRVIREGVRLELAVASDGRTGPHGAHRVEYTNVPTVDPPGRTPVGRGCTIDEVPSGIVRVAHRIRRRIAWEVLSSVDEPSSLVVCERVPAVRT